LSLNFPSAPTVGQEYTSDGLTFVWSGVVWYVRSSLQWATDAEAVAGFAADRVMTPGTLKAASDANPVTPGSPVGVPTVVTRSFAVNYQNTVGYPMLVAINLAGNSTEDSNATPLIGDANPANRTVYASIGVRRNGDSSFQFIVPTGWWYRLDRARNPILTRWTEWR